MRPWPRQAYPACALNAGPAGAALGSFQEAMRDFTALGGIISAGRALQAEASILWNARISRSNSERAPRRGSTHQADEEQQDDGANRGPDQRPEEAGPVDHAQSIEQPAADEGADDADDDVADQAVPGNLDDTACGPRSDPFPTDSQHRAGHSLIRRASIRVGRAARPTVQPDPSRRARCEECR